ncbi:MAG: VOC family protein [Minicystis sp.]
MAILDHLGITVTNYVRSKEFYAKALAPLGIGQIMEFGEACGFGRDGKPDFWIGTKPDFQSEAQAKSPTPVHVAFAANSREDVDAFYAAAIAAGGKDNGAPGLRPQYHPGYYGAFVLDLDGNNVEAVVHR